VTCVVLRVQNTWPRVKSVLRIHTDIQSWGDCRCCISCSCL